MIPNVNKKNFSTTEAILQQLRNDINNLHYNDQFITEAEVSSRFQVSRTPAREALNILCQEGILEKIPRKGYLIRKLSLSELQELCQYRSILECGAVEYAIRFASDSELEKIYQIASKKIDLNDSNFYTHYNELNLEFHLSIARITNNSYLISAMENVFYRLRRDLVIDGRSNLENSLDMHIQLAAAMKKRDLEQARRITADQIEFVEKDYIYIKSKENTIMLNELWKMTAHQVKEANFTKAIISIGSCEAHGQHIAEGCDTLVAYKLSKQIADQVDGMMVIPPITIGYSAHYDSFPFSLTLSYDTTIAVLYDTIESVLRNGINHIFIMNGHDGNIAPIEIASRKIKEKYPEAQIAALTQWWVAAGNLLPKDTFEVWDGLGHAGEGETSIAYYLFPDWCEPEYATCIVPNLPSEVEIKWDFSELTDTAQTGDATKGTAEKGKKMNDVIVEHVVKTLKELDATDWKYKPVK